MTTKFKSVTSILLIPILAVISATGYIQYNNSSRRLNDTEVIHVSARKLYTTYNSDPSNAGSIYTGKILMVQGEIFKIFYKSQQHGIVLLKTGRPQSFINCTFEDLREITNPTGNMIVKGICRGAGLEYPELGITSDVYLTGCIPVKEKP